MYNDDYFRKVLGNDYKEDELFTPTYIPDYKKYKEVENIKEDANMEKEENKKIENKTKVVEKVKEIAKDVGDNILDLYPDIYNIVMPVIESVIKKNSELTITKDVIDAMTYEIYNIIEDEEEEENSSSETVQVSARPHRRPRNKNLCDLIQILLIDYLRPHHRPAPRPPMPPHNHPFPEDFNP